MLALDVAFEEYFQVTDKDQLGKWLDQNDTNDVYGSFLDEVVNLEYGTLTKKQLNMMLNTIPVGIVFVDTENYIKYLNMPEDHKEMRNTSIVGRNLKYSFSPKLYSRFEKIIDDFKSGNCELYEYKELASVNGKTFKYSYMPVNDKNGKYNGFVEFTEIVED